MFVGDGKDRGLPPITVRKIPANMYVAMAGGALLCTLYGIVPWLLYAELPYPLAYEPFTTLKVVATLQLLTATAAGFWLYLKKLGGEPTISLDTDWFYRKPAAKLNWILDALRGVKGTVEARGGVLFQAAVPYVHNPLLVGVGFLRNVSYKAARSLEQGGWTEKTVYDEHRHRVSTQLNVFFTALFMGAMLLVLYTNL
jgi:multicomponent Na+:H+ antiporter subunit D